MSLQAMAVLCRYAVLLLALSLSGHSLAAGKAKGDDCENKKTALARALCGDTELAELDRWTAEAYKDSLGEPDKTTRQAAQSGQKSFLKERGQCLPKESAAVVAQAHKASEAEGASISALPSGAPTETTAAPSGAATGDLQKPDNVAEPVPPAADEDEDEPEKSPEEISTCLRKAYKTRIATLELKLRRFADLSSDVPSVASVCAAVDTLRGQGRLMLLARHAVTLMPVDEASEMHPTQKAAHLRRYLSDEAWKSAESTMPTWNSALGTVTIYRAPLIANQPPIWILSTLSGENHDRDILLFEGGDATADRFLGHIGGDGAGTFDPMFVRFKGQAFAIEQVGPPYSSAPNPGIYALDQSKPACNGAIAAAGK